MSSELFLALFATGYLYFAFWLSRGLRRVRSASGTARPAVSVVVAARNERDCLPGLLSALQQQTYPRDLCEFIIVDDRSNDGTAVLLEAWRARLPLRYRRIDTVARGANPKKLALAAGIRRARGEVIITTDADCVPPPQWLESVAGAFEADVGAIVGLSPWHAAGKWWSSILALESLATAAVALAGVGHGRPFLAVGRNFAFRRELFDRVGGYAADMHLLSGDDDLLLQRIGRIPGYRIAAVFTRSSHVRSRGAPDLPAFLRQKRRHISAARVYPRPQQLGYTLYHLCNTVLWLSPLLLGVGGLSVLLAKILLDALVFYQARRRCGWEFGWSAFVPWQLLFWMLHVGAGPAALLGRVHWKS